MPALDGMKVLDLTQYEAGTTSTQYLAWFGADVMKVERPGVGDPGRHVAGGDMDALYFLTFNHNKRSVAIALDTPSGRDLFLKLVPKVDVVVENFTLGTMEKLGLGYDTLKEANPGLIYATVKGFGTYGPYSKFKCFDLVAQAAGGSSAYRHARRPADAAGATLATPVWGCTAPWVSSLPTSSGCARARARSPDRDAGDDRELMREPIRSGNSASLIRGG
jgi:formyl-CoA transferase